MTLAWLAAILAVLVFGLIWLSWDVTTSYRRRERAWRRARWLVRFPAYSDEWAEFQAEVAERRLLLAEALETPGALDRLAALVDEARLEVVA